MVGGGINGAGIARDAAGRGLSVCLCERDDLAAHTSSASTKLIHGGLRYLEQFEFALVGKALAEREVLLKAAPHVIWPLRFVLPHQSHLRPAWMIRIGLFLYDHLGRGKRSLAGSRTDPLREHAVGKPLRSEFHTGFVYSDAWVQDARLVVLNAMDAQAAAPPSCRAPAACRRRAATQGWTAELESRRRQPPHGYRARRWSMPPVRGRCSFSTTSPRSATTMHCAWSRAATSWCRACSSTTTPTSSSSRIGASCSPSPTSTTSR